MFKSDQISKKYRTNFEPGTGDDVIKQGQDKSSKICMNMDEFFHIKYEHMQDF